MSRLVFTGTEDDVAPKSKCFIKFVFNEEDFEEDLVEQERQTFPGSTKDTETRNVSEQEMK